jgi:hypothetical protein
MDVLGSLAKNKFTQLRDEIPGVIRHIDYKDGKKLFQTGLVGAIGFTVYQLVMDAYKTNACPSTRFKDNVDCLYLNPVLGAQFMKLQEYRKLNKFLFRSAITVADRLCILHDALISGHSPPKPNDKEVAFILLSVTSNHLTRFQWEVKEHMTTDHVYTVHLIVNEIFKELEKLNDNILAMCSKYDPHLLVNRAKQDVEKVLRSTRVKRRKRKPKHSTQ